MKNLETLRVLHIVKGALNILATLAFVFFASIPKKMLPFDQVEGLEFIYIFIAAMSFFPLALGVYNFVTAGHIINRKSKTSIIICSVFNCMSGVLGLALGIFTIVEVTKNGFIVEDEEGLSLDSRLDMQRQRELRHNDYVD